MTNKWEKGYHGCNVQGCDNYGEELNNTGGNIMICNYHLREQEELEEISAISAKEDLSTS